MFVILGKLLSSEKSWRCLIQKSFVIACLSAQKLNTILSFRLHHTGKEKNKKKIINS